MKKILDYIKSHKYCLILIYWPLHSIFYEIVRAATADQEVLLIESKLDSMIPFCEWFIIPYVIWYVAIAWVLLWSLSKGKREFLRAEGLIMFCTVFPMLFCAVVPNGIPLSMRPDFETLGRENIATKLVELIYLADSPPRNVMPSMHVSVSWAMFFAVMQSRFLKGNWIFKLCSGILAILISLATVFIKQHSILDVFAGVSVAVVGLIVIYICEKAYDKRRINEKSA